MFAPLYRTQRNGKLRKARLPKAEQGKKLKKGLGEVSGMPLSCGCEHRTAGRRQQRGMEWRPVHHPSRWPLTVKAELQQGNRSCCREAFVSEKESGETQPKLCQTSTKAVELGKERQVLEAAPLWVCLKSLRVSVTWQYLPKPLKQSEKERSEECTSISCRWSG